MKAQEASGKLVTCTAPQTKGKIIQNYPDGDSRK